jgi:hypothetical protein
MTAFLQNKKLVSTYKQGMIFALGLGVLSACNDTSQNNTPQNAGQGAPQSIEQSVELAKSDLSFNAERAIANLKYLSSDEMAGRQTGTEGNAKARTYIIEQLKSLDVSPVGSQYEHTFDFTRKSRDGSTRKMSGINLLATIAGTGSGDARKQIVVSAHYDHVGVHDGEIYNGADDNASGVVGLLELIAYFKNNQPQNDMIFAFFDAEEMGLRGARAFVEPYNSEGLKADFNINFDMLSRSDKNELYAAGGFHTPSLKPMLDDLKASVPVTLMMGHDDPALGSDDWTLQSDHGPFHRMGIPFIYFGVEDHPHYHQPSDEFESVPQDFFLRSIETVIMASEMVDKRLNDIVSGR